jgi:Extensin-like protein C-terminus
MNQDDHSGFRDLVSAIAVCGLVLLAALTAPWWGSAQRWFGTLEDWLPVAPSEQGEKAPEGPTVTWTDKEIEAALMQCVQVLAPVTADVDSLAPIRRGDCGAPAPVLLRSIGAVDKVSFDPPLVLNCAMVAALDRWLRDRVQPAAREAFSSPVSKIIGSSYACRNVYNRPDGHLSQHAFANAIDLPTFVLADGRKIDVTRGWGPTQRDLIAAAKAKKAVPGTTGSPAQQKTNSKGATTEVVKVSTAAASNSAKTNSGGAATAGASGVSCVSRTTAAANYSRQCLAPRPMMRIGLICTWTFKTERR